jgi:haloalkane dehalogenase
MKLLRTPEERFSAVPDFPYAPAYTQLGKIRMAHVEAGEGPVILMLHGEPTWSFLYRKMIPIFADAGFRAIAPDLVGFGRSDKPTRPSDYSYAGHVAWMLQWLEANDLQDITLVCQDWGSLIGLRLAAEHPQHFSRIAVANGFLPIADRPAPIAFKAWRAFARYTPVFPTGQFVQAGTTSRLSAETVAAYDAPFPSEKYKAAARAFPRLVPTSPDDPAVPANRAAWDALGKWDRPFLTAFGKKDPILGWADKLLRNHGPGTEGQPHRDLGEAGHFVQEDAGEQLAQLVADWCHATTA